MESILAAAFGRVINIQRGEADEVTEAAKGIFAAGRNWKVRSCLGLVSTLQMHNHNYYKISYDLTFVTYL